MYLHIYMHRQDVFNNQTVHRLYEIPIAETIVGLLMKIRNMVLRADFEGTPLAITLPRLLDATIVPMPTYLSGPEI